MGQASLKRDRRALRRAAKKEKNSIVSTYMTDNWDKVLVASVNIIRHKFTFKNRFRIAMMILFKPLKEPKDKPAAPETN